MTVFFEKYDFMTLQKEIYDLTAKKSHNQGNLQLKSKNKEKFHQEKNEDQKKKEKRSSISEWQ